MNKKTTKRIRKIAFFMAILMLFSSFSMVAHATAEDTLYYATFAPEIDGCMPFKLIDEATVEVEEWYFNDALVGMVGENNENVIPFSNASFTFPETLIVRKLYYQVDCDYGNAGEFSYFVYVTNEDWPAALDEYRVLTATSEDGTFGDVIIGDVYDPDVTKLEARLGSFNASVEGSTVPADAKLHIQSIAEKDVDPGIWERKDVNMKSFIACFDLKIMQGLSQWQPNGKKVTVTMNAAALGLYTGQEVYIIHMHENADGSKEYEILGPTYVVNGQFSFNTEKFSEFAIFQGNGAVVIKENSTIWVEPGSTVALAVEYDGSPNNAVYKGGNDIEGKITRGSANAAAICAEGSGKTMTVVVSSSAAIGDQTTYQVRASLNIFGYDVERGSTYTITVIVGSRAQVTDVALKNYPLVIGIRKPAADGSFPSEPTNTTYDSSGYFFLNDVNANGDQEDDAIVNDFVDYSSQASVYLNSTEMGKSFGWMYDVNGNAIGGVIDAMGYYTKKCFNTASISWDEIAQVIATHNDSVLEAAGFDPSTVTPTQIEEAEGAGNLTNLVFVRYKQEDATQAGGFKEYAIALTTADKTIASYGQNGVSNFALVHYSEFELIPYVIKLMPAKIESSGWFNTSSDSAWHVDIAVVRGDSYTISYDLNLGSNIVTTTKVTLPVSRVFVESPSDNDTELIYTFATTYTTVDGVNYYDDEPNPTTIEVYSVDDIDKVNKTTVNAHFKGWCRTNTYSEGDELYGPNNTTSITITGNQKLYAIWELEESIGITTTSFSIDKQVHLTPDSPTGSTKPSYGDKDFLEFDFELVIPYDPSSTATKDEKLGEMRVEANKWNENSKQLETIPTTTYADDGSVIYNPITLKELCDSTEVLSFITVTKGTGNITLSFKLRDGEYIHFLDVPYFNAESEIQYNVYSVKESLSDEAKERYTASNPEQTITLSETADARATFYNLYAAPVAGLTISAIGGDKNQCFIYEVTCASITNFGTIVVAVPANGSVTIANLVADKTYKVTAKTTWDVLWDTTTTSQDITLPEEGSATASFTYAQDGKWLFSHAFK